MASNYGSYEQVGKAEDVSQIISNIDPTDTPFTSSIGSQKVRARLPEWQEDSLATAKSISMAEGGDFSDETLSPTVMRSNYTEIMGLAFNISATADAIDTHGRRSETAYQTAKKGQEVKRHREYVMCGAAQNAAVGSGGTGSAVRKLGNVWGTDPSSNAILANNTDVTTDDTIAEDDVIAAQQACYDRGSTPDTLMLNQTYVMDIAKFSTRADGTNALYYTRDMGNSKTYVNAVDVIVTPFGTLKVMMNRWFPVDYALLYKASNWKRGVLRPMTRTKLAKTHDGERYSMVCEETLMHTNYDADQKITVNTA